MECFVSIVSFLHYVLLIVGKSEKYYTYELHAGTLKARNFGLLIAKAKHDRVAHKKLSI